MIHLRLPFPPSLNGNQRGSHGQRYDTPQYVEANRLTDAVFDPYSKQPSYKACAVRMSLVP